MPDQSFVQQAGAFTADAAIDTVADSLINQE